ncbi:MAG: dihydropteroate synthase [Acetobacteraceae bacterium]|nr:dihydropteroate synthase [Acetobacteraceae bacterium]
MRTSVAWTRRRNRVNARPPRVRLIEPLGLLHGREADDAMAAGLALKLAGGPSAFTLARLIVPGMAPVLVPVGAIPGDWRAHMRRITAAPRAWAGLPVGKPLVMGILNITPDSFSDGGAHFNSVAAISTGHAMAAAGAAILDIGGESTRPRAPPVPAAEEQRRILPVIRALAAAGHCISVDTRNASTMAAALDAGARIVNDVSALTHDPAAAPLLARRGCPVVLVHMRGTPADMQDHAHYGDPALEILSELAARVATARAAGIAPINIAIDPGIGFAKQAQQNQDALHRLALLANLGHRIVLGVSRKSFIGQIGLAPDARARLPGSLAAGLFGVTLGAHILRTHDVTETMQALRLWYVLQSEMEL